MQNSRYIRYYNIPTATSPHLTRIKISKPDSKRASDAHEHRAGVVRQRDGGVAAGDGGGRVGGRGAGAGGLGARGPHVVLVGGRLRRLDVDGPEPGDGGGRDGLDGGGLELARVAAKDFLLAGVDVCFGSEGGSV